MGKAQYKVTGGKLIKVQLLKKENKISKIKITGDFFLHPEEFIEELENHLVGLILDEKKMTRQINILVKKRNATLLGVSPKDFVNCIMLAGKNYD